MYYHTMHWIPEPIPRGDDSNLPTHLSYDIDNPCARIYCRSGKLILAACVGRCYGCKLEREAYIATQVFQRFERIRRDPSLGGSLDHDDESPTLSSIEQEVRSEIAILDQRKELFIPKSQDLRSGVTRNIENTIDPRLPQSPYQGETD